MKYKENIQRFLAKGKKIMRLRGYRKRSEIPEHELYRNRAGLTDAQWEAGVKQTAFTPRCCSCHMCKRYDQQKRIADLREQLRIAEELEEL